MPAVDPFDLEDVDPVRIVASYSAIKGWRTRNEAKLRALIALQDVTYSPVSAKDISETLKKLEDHTDALEMMARHLASIQHEGHADHTAECGNFRTTLTDLTRQVVDIAHKHVWWGTRTHPRHKWPLPLPPLSSQRPS